MNNCMIRKSITADESTIKRILGYYNKISAHLKTHEIYHIIYYIKVFKTTYNYNL